MYYVIAKNSENKKTYVSTFKEKREAVLWPEAVEQLFLNRSLWNSQSSLCFLALLCGKGLK